MGSSKNSDADIRLSATLDSTDVQQELQQIGQSASSSLDGAARSAEGLSTSMEKVAEKTKLSHQRITSMSVAMAGMGLQLGASVLESRGMSIGARYLQGSGQMAMTGAAAMAPIGPYGAAVGAAGGAAIGAGKTFFDLRSEDNAREKANAGALEKFHDLRDAANEAREFYGRLADATLSASDRQNLLSGRMAEFERQAESLLDALRTDDLQRDGKAFAETMQQYIAALKEVDKAASAAQVFGEDGMSESKTGSAGSRLGDFDALQRMGITVGGGSGAANSLATLTEKGNRILEDSLQELRMLNEGGMTACYA